MKSTTRFFDRSHRFHRRHAGKLGGAGFPGVAFALLLLFSLTLSPLHAERYDGQVGKLKAIFNLDWGGDNSVGGTYRYPSRKGIVYRLEGEVTEDGKLVLREYTGTNLTAVLMLKDTGGGSKVRWSGKMQNTDGREFEVWFGE